MRTVAMLALGLGMLLASCSGAEPPEPVEITIDMSEYAFRPDDIALRVGQEVTLVLINSGALEHELMIGREMFTNEGKPSGYAIDFFGVAGVEPMLVTETSPHEEGGEHEESTDHHDEGEDHSQDMDMGGHGHEGFMALVQSGQMVNLSFTVTEDMIGEWEMGCFLLDGVHYTSGMMGKLTVGR